MSFSASGLVDDINEMLNRAEPHSTGAEPLSPFDCFIIYKVPSHIRTLNENAYTPNFVSIGPFHHGHPQYQNMERHKLIYFKAFLQRTTTCLNTLVCYIGSILSDFPGCYSETLKFSQNDLVKLILIDSGFIIQLFWTTFHCGRYPFEDGDIIYDLLLLENQLPFFVIEEIYKLSLSSTNASVPNTMIPSFLELAFYYFDYFNKSNLSFDNGDISIFGIRHFTDLIRTFHLPHPIESWPSRRDLIKIEIDPWIDSPSRDLGKFKIHHRILHLPSTTELLEAGVKFKVNPESESLLSFRFSGRVLEIPKLRVDDWTETLFRNMVALEHCHYPCKSYIIDYVAVMDYLIKTGKDVDILVQKKILENCLGDSDSVATLFNGLCTNVNHFNTSSPFSIPCEGLIAFCSDPSNKLKASLKSSLKRDYCNTPWNAAASFAGIILLVLTFIQTVCSVLQSSTTT